MSTRREMVQAGVMLTDAIATNGGFDTGVTATGATQATAYPIRASNTVITTCPAGSGVVVPPGDQGDWMQICNFGASTMLVYPPLGWQMHNLAVNAGYAVGAGKTATITQITDPAKGGQQQFIIFLSA